MPKLAAHLPFKGPSNFRKTPAVTMPQNLSRRHRHPPGLLLRNFNHIAIIQKPYYLPYIHILVTQIKFLNSKPASHCRHPAIEAGSSYGARLRAAGRAPRLLRGPVRAAVGRRPRRSEGPEVELFLNMRCQSFSNHGTRGSILWSSFFFFLLLFLLLLIFVTILFLGAVSVYIHLFPSSRSKG